jgi:clan AA aspartic protease
MIAGVVKFPEAWIRLEVRGSRRLRREVDAILDTGYTGLLSLSPALVAPLWLRWKSFGRAVLADGNECLFDVYVAKILWDGRARIIRVDESDAEPLVGMSLLKRYELTMQIRAGGSVRIKRLSKE